MKIARQHGGAFLCDGVGLGKTFVGLMLIERLVVHERKRVVLFVPKAAREAVWERDLRQYLPHLASATSATWSSSTTPTCCAAATSRSDFERIKELADVVVIDEAHHFRNPGSKGEEGETTVPLLAAVRHLMPRARQLFMLTATPVNNRLSDFQHMIELFTRRRGRLLQAAPLGHSLPAAATSARWRRRSSSSSRQSRRRRPTSRPTWSRPSRSCRATTCSGHLVVQRSRAYVKREPGAATAATAPSSPSASDPQVAEYSSARPTAGCSTCSRRPSARKSPLFSLADVLPAGLLQGPGQEHRPAWRRTGRSRSSA